MSSTSTTTLCAALQASPASSVPPAHPLRPGPGHRRVHSQQTLPSQAMLAEPCEPRAAAPQRAQTMARLSVQPSTAPPDAPGGTMHGDMPAPLGMRRPASMQHLPISGKARPAGTGSASGHSDVSDVRVSGSAAAQQQRHTASGIVGPEKSAGGGSVVGPPLQAQAPPAPGAQQQQRFVVQAKEPRQHDVLDVRAAIHRLVRLQVREAICGQAL